MRYCPKCGDLLIETDINGLEEQCVKCKTIYSLKPNTTSNKSKIDKLIIKKRRV